MLNETEDGSEQVLFFNGKTLSLVIVRSWGWERVLDYAKEGSYISHKQGGTNLQRSHG